MAVEYARYTDARHAVINNTGRDQINTTFISDSQDVLDKLQPLKMDASRRTECLPNTRMEVLKYIYDWVNDMESEQNILWVHGLAGSGKSTLSTTIANTYSDSGQLGAFVFFSRDDTERSGPTTFVRTLAHQIGSFNQRIGAAIRAVLESNSNILMYPLPRQFQRLVLDPLLEVEAPFPRIVIVLDALDECGTADEREILLTVLSQDFANLPSTIRTIVTSRAENDIHIAFDSQHHIRPYQLDITSTGNAVDILTYFRHRMAFIRTKNRHLRLGTDWPGEEIFLQLVQRASGLFVWASTAVEFINGHAPKRRLDSILKGDASSGAEAALDTLYMTALDSAGLWDDEDFVVEFRSILGIILTARQPLSSSALDALLNLPEDRPSIHTISLLRCVLQHHPNVRVLHPSFADFLMNKDRCNRDIWHFDPSVYHRILAFGCLDRMDAVLRRNMCNMTLTVDGAIESLPEDVSYSCMFWVDHVCIIDDDVRPVVDRLHGFLFRHLIHWFEAMSILHRARDTIPLLEILIDWLSRCSQNDTRLFQLVSDAHRFAIGFIRSIEEHPLLVYMSALPFTPTDTSIYRSFHDCLEYPSLLVGFQRTWSPMGRELAGHTGEVVSVAVSSDGMRVVSASYDKTIRVWDAIVGAEISEMRGHESLHSIGCVGISPDGRWVVSGSGDATVRVWDAISGAHVAEMRGHHAKVLSVHLSPDGHRVASGSCDNTVRVWNTATGSQVLPTITGHTDWVGTVAFSADGKMIVSGSNDGTIRVWNAISGAEVQPAPRGYIDWVCCVAFSPDGTRIISGSVDETVRVWDRATGTQVLALQGHRGNVNSVTFSPDGHQIISGADDKTIRVWDATSGSHISTLRGHERSVITVACFPDGHRIISGSLDTTIRIWDMFSDVEVPPIPQRRSDRILSVAFSPDESKIVSHSLDSTIRIWDAVSGTEVTVIKGHTKKLALARVTFSLDGCYVISCLHDGTVQVWDAASGARVVSGSMYNNIIRNPLFKQSQGLNSNPDRYGWIVDPVTHRTILKLPSYISHSCYSICKGLLAVGAGNGRLLVVHIPPALLVSPDTRTVDGMERPAQKLRHGPPKRSNFYNDWVPEDRYFENL